MLSIRVEDESQTRELRLLRAREVLRNEPWNLSKIIEKKIE